MGAVRTITLDALWRSAEPATEAFDHAQTEDLPPLAARYLQAAIPDGALLYRAARLSMHGEMKLGDRWLPFEATQVIHAKRGFIWQASMRMGILPIRGSDRYVDGEGFGQWRLFGLIPVASDGPSADMNRSASDRFRIESIWLPSMLVGAARWSERTEDTLEVVTDIGPFGGSHQLTLDRAGRVEQAVMQRWGKPPGSETFIEAPFGAFIDGYASFSGYQLPSELRVGWYPAGDGFEHDGEFWRATVDGLVFV